MADCKFSAQRDWFTYISWENVKPREQTIQKNGDIQANKLIEAICP